MSTVAGTYRHVLFRDPVCLASKSCMFIKACAALGGLFWRRLPRGKPRVVHVHHTCLHAYALALRPP